MSISQYDQMGYAQYKPLSIEEIWAPGREMRAQHDKLEEEYAQQELLGGAASLGLQKGVDDVAIATNQAYMGAIKSAADELATKGFNSAGRRRQLLALKNQYTQNVLPIQNALKYREDAIKMHNERLAKDQTYRSTFDPSKVAVTDYLNNNQAFTSKGVSGQAVYTDAAQAISNLKSVAATELPALKRSGLIDQYFTLMNNGLRPEQAAALMQKNSKSQAEAESWTPMAKMTVAAIDGAMQRHGVFDVFKDRPDIIDEFWQNTSKAAIFGIGESKIGTMKDDWNMKMREMAMSTPPEPPEILREFNASFDKDGIKNATSKINKLKDLDSEINSGLSKSEHERGSGVTLAPLAKSYGRVLSKEEIAAKKKERETIIRDIEKESGVEYKHSSVPGSYSSWIDRASSVIQENYKWVNRTSYNQNANDVVQNIISKKSEGDIPVFDTNKKQISEFTAEPGTKSAVHWNAKTGDVEFKYTPKGDKKRITVAGSADDFGSELISNLARIVKSYSKASKSRELNEIEKSNYDAISREFDNAMNMAANTQQSVYNNQIGK